ncbi:MAG TPA: hypothetical protein VNA25_26710 [Phycisphaerae bacterium]|nr:hypothetical protein [Phycisphaerae bacterium]
MSNETLPPIHPSGRAGELYGVGAISPTQRRRQSRKPKPEGKKRRRRKEQNPPADEADEVAEAEQPAAADEGPQAHSVDVYS